MMEEIIVDPPSIIALGCKINIILKKKHDENINIQRLGFFDKPFLEKATRVN
jgi:hypothetical protein